MTFFESISTVFRKYADFSGVARRSEYWWFVLFVVIVNAVINSLNLATANGDGSGAIGIGSILAAIWSLGILLPQLAVAVRRLRDTGRKWTNLFWMLLPIAGPIILIVFLAQPSTTSRVASAS